jgi:hypothetical protein
MQQIENFAASLAVLLGSGSDGHSSRRKRERRGFAVESTEEFVHKLQENRENAEHNRKQAKGDPGKQLPNKRKGTMK